jgi:hypothetical protein
MPLPKEQAWFPAKRYGYGWGFPSRWQGWAAFAAFFGATFAGLQLLPRVPAYFIGYMAILTGLFIALCYWKGEPARWRWGDDSERPNR